MRNVRAWRWLGIPGLLYLAVAGLVAGCQRKLIYHPPHLTAEQLRPYQDRHRLLPWTNAAGARIGWWRPAPSHGPKSEPWLVFHGNAGSAAGRDYIIDPIQAGVGADVYVLEYPGYADRPGNPTEASLVAAGLESLDHISGRSPVVLVGESLGSGVASAVAGAAPDRIRAVLLLVPFRELAEAAASHYPWLPVRWLLRDRFPSHEHLARYPGPVGFVVAEADEVVPADSGRRLHAGFHGPKRLWVLPGESHWQGSNRNPSFYSEFDAWRRSVTPASGRPD